MLVRLVYASRAAATIGEHDFNAILKSSREHNQAEGITGLLCFNEGVFIQLLEGGRNAVNARYKQIIDDARHKDVILLAYDEIQERQFAGWAMGNAQLSRANRAMLLKYSESAKLDPYAMSGKALIGLFHEMVSAGAIACS
ncbi:BLUF domain-containing protein [Paucibacter sp. R3-3]|uniref:BLUF domain-containing protein n=1 Tax=Roseateles agri TaxID=3098619 RepID=A0ABU5DAY3_9BURK|nr:BLUF domain-containing protein [Paucibacter sp. R3-3]MDY0743404.1 BLUF domain-containing protein [Paucibacter sp. R3-3]